MTTVILESDQAAAFQWISDNMAKLQAFVRGDDEMWNLIYAKVPVAIARFDATLYDDDYSKAEDKWVWYSLRLWRNKYIARRYRREQQCAVVEDLSYVEQRHTADDDHHTMAERLIKLVHDPIDRKIFTWIYLKGFDAVEVAEHLGMRASAVRSRISRALKVLRRRAIELYPEGMTK